MNRIVLLLVLSLPAFGQVSNTSYRLPGGERVARHEAIVDAAPSEVWKAFTTAEKMRGFIAPVVGFELKIGGDWEASYNADAKLGQPGNIHNEVLSYVPDKMLSIRIKETPPGFPHAELAKSVWTVIWFENVGGGKTRVTTEMLPFREGEGWEMLYKMFEAGNGITLQRLQQFFRTGPVDWSKK
jgi:uncharacterized protein YndB with AHSA1/START domain